MNGETKFLSVVSRGLFDRKKFVKADYEILEGEDGYIDMCSAAHAIVKEAARLRENLGTVSCPTATNDPDEEKPEADKEKLELSEDEEDNDSDVTVLKFNR